eukprot:jgi/Mesvir1/20522/Mv12401-RA.1
MLMRLTVVAGSKFKVKSVSSRNGCRKLDFLPSSLSSVHYIALMTAKKLSGTSQGNSQPLYHETQERQYCLKHALNNLLQSPRFSLDDLHEIAKRLAPSAIPFNNPHRSLLTGNWDANVLLGAAEQLGLDLVWWDRRKPLDQLDLSGGCVGIILNVPSRGGADDWLIKRWWNGDTGGRHWFALAPLPGRSCGSPEVRPVAAAATAEWPSCAQGGSVTVTATEVGTVREQDAGQWHARGVGGVEGGEETAGMGVADGRVMPVADALAAAAGCGECLDGLVHPEGGREGERATDGEGNLSPVASVTTRTVPEPAINSHAGTADRTTGDRGASSTTSRSGAHAGGSVWYNHDSYLLAAEPLGSEDRVRAFLAPLMAPDADCHVMLLKHRESDPKAAPPG